MRFRNSDTLGDEAINPSGYFPKIVLRRGEVAGAIQSDSTLWSPRIRVPLHNDYRRLYDVDYPDEWLQHDH